jgi:hypothetical protein
MATVKRSLATECLIFLGIKGLVLVDFCGRFVAFRGGPIHFLPSKKSGHFLQKRQKRIRHGDKFVDFRTCFGVVFHARDDIFGSGRVIWRCAFVPLIFNPCVFTQG